MRESDHYKFGDVPFAFQVTGVRDGFENGEVIIDIENIHSQEISEKRAAYNEKVKKVAKKIKKAKKNKK